MKQSRARPLPRIGRQLLRAARDANDMPARTRAEVWRRLQADQPPPARRERVGWRPIAIAAVVAAAAALTLVSLRPQATSQTTESKESQASDVVQPQQPDGYVQPAQPRATPASVPALAPAVPPVEVLPLEAIPGASARPRRAIADPTPDTTAPGDPPESRSTLAEERRLVAAAWSALEAGNIDDALRLAETHARRFPGGTLAPEREAVQAIGLCRSGAQRGQVAVVSFLTAHPDSPLARKVQAACEQKKQPAPAGTSSGAHPRESGHQ